MNVFWKSKPLAKVEETLLNLCLDAHAKSAVRDNISTSVLQQVAAGSFDYGKSVAAAILTTGGMHAPLMDSYGVLMTDISQVEKAAEVSRIPGWGNSFEKGKPDPIWSPVETFLREHFTNISDKIDAVTQMLQGKGRDVYPNPSVMTAAVGMALQMPPQVLTWFFIAGRLTTWSALYLHQLASMNKEKEKK